MTLSKVMCCAVKDAVDWFDFPTARRFMWNKVTRARCSFYFSCHAGVAVSMSVDIQSCVPIVNVFDRVGDGPLNHGGLHRPNEKVSTRCKAELVIGYLVDVYALGVGVDSPLLHLFYLYFGVASTEIMDRGLSRVRKGRCDYITGREHD